jgi:hypothetical protein
MAPVYAISSFLQIYLYRYAVYFRAVSDCYEAFAIASLFTLICQYVAPDIYEQSDFFRDMYPIRPWAWPISWLASCCGGQRGVWKTPQSGLTWFNIIWLGVHNHCFIRSTMAITAAITQLSDRFCATSNSPVFANIWVSAQTAPRRR